RQLLDGEAQQRLGEYPNRRAEEVRFNMTSLLLKSTVAVAALFPLVLASSVLAGCSNNNAGLQAQVDSLQAELNKYKADEALQKTRFATFDTLDYDFYSNQQWD